MAICEAAGCGRAGTETFRVLDPARRSQVITTVVFCREHADEIRRRCPKACSDHRPK